MSHQKFQRFIQTCYHKLFKRPYVYQYKNVIDKLTGIEEAEDYVYPSIVPNWDHTPRSGYGGYLLDNSTPDLFDLQSKERLLMQSGIKAIMIKLFFSSHGMSGGKAIMWNQIWSSDMVI